MSDPYTWTHVSQFGKGIKDDSLILNLVHLNPADASASLIDLLSFIRVAPNVYVIKTVPSSIDDSLPSIAGTEFTEEEARAVTAAFSRLTPESTLSE